MIVVLVIIIKIDHFSCLEEDIRIAMHLLPPTIDNSKVILYPSFFTVILCVFAYFPSLHILRTPYTPAGDSLTVD